MASPFGNSPSFAIGGSSPQAATTFRRQPRRPRPQTSELGVRPLRQRRHRPRQPRQTSNSSRPVSKAAKSSPPCSTPASSAASSSTASTSCPSGRPTPRRRTRQTSYLQHRRVATSPALTAAEPTTAPASPRSFSAGTSSPNRAAFNPGFRGPAASSTPPTSSRLISLFPTELPVAPLSSTSRPRAAEASTSSPAEERSIDLGINAVHISSASLGDRNPGVNASIQVQIGYTFWKYTSVETAEFHPGNRRSRKVEFRGWSNP